jgi:hypothetical protein
MRQNRSAPVGVREQPEVFCASFTIRRSRSDPLLSNGAERSVRKRSTSSRHSRSRLMRGTAGFFFRTRLGTFCRGTPF